MNGRRVLANAAILLQFIASLHCETVVIVTSVGEGCFGDVQCSTLQQYVSNLSQSSDIVLELQPGNHTLNSELSVANIDNFTMTGNDSQVICTSTAALISLTSIQNTLITGVSFIGCGRNVLSTNGNRLEIRNSQFYQNRINIIEAVNSLLVMDSVFNGNSETALDLRSYVNSAVVEGCVFSNNGYRGITAVSANLEISESTFFRNRGPQGGCLHAQSSTITIKVSKFTECMSVGGHDGGALYGSQVTFIITDTNFTDNEATFGGGAVGGTESFNITNCNFIRNSGTQWGGAIKADFSTRSLSVFNTNFFANVARVGGGIHARRLTSLVCSNFIDNRALTGDGGGLWVETIHSISILYCDFMNNTNDERGGGAFIEVRSVVDNISVNVVGSSFTDNVAGRGRGGGLYFSSNGQYASMTVTETSFRNNTARTSDESIRSRDSIYGGGIYICGSKSSIFVYSSSFIMNIASGSGGAIYVTGSISINSSTLSNNKALTDDGGAIVSNQQDAHVTVTQSTFSFNMAPSCGAISVQNSNHVVTLIDSTFIHNEAMNSSSSGGVACFNNASISIVACNFLNNTSNYHGGVPLIQYGNFRLEDSLFHNNLAIEDGGVIYINTTLEALSIIHHCTFNQNKAGSDGGALFMENIGSWLSISQCNFSNNNATGKGGSMQIIGSRMQINETNFVNNTAGLGDAIHACDSVVSLPDSEFTLMSSNSDNCTLYDGNVNSFSGVVSHSIDVVIDTNLDTFAVTMSCPSDVIHTTTTSAVKTITTTKDTVETIPTVESSEALPTAEMTDDSPSMLSPGPTLSEAAIGGIVASILILVILVLTVIGVSYCLYHSVYKKFRNYNLKQSLLSVPETEMSLSVKNDDLVKTQDAADAREAQMNLSEQTLEYTKGPTDEVKADLMKCPVCQDIHIDPCTLECGHTVCQLCLANMWKSGDQFCPVCKHYWQVFPAITIDYRDNIESFCGDKVAQLRNTYTSEDKALIDEFVLAKTQSSLKLNAATHQHGSVTQATVDEEALKTGVTVFENPQSFSTSTNKSDLHLSSQSMEDGMDATECWHTHSTTCARTFEPDEHIYASPRHKSVGSKSSGKFPKILRIRKHPDSCTNIKYHDNVTLSVTAVGEGSLYYKWKRNGNDIAPLKCAGIDTDTLSISCFSPEHEGNYTCVVSNYEEAIESEHATLMLGLQIRKQPKIPPHVKYRERVVLLVSAVGSPESLSYCWKLDGKDVDLPTCTGTKTRILVISSCTIEHQGKYTCVVRNSCGSVAESEPVELKLEMEFIPSMSDDDFFIWLELNGLSKVDRQCLRGENITASLFKLLKAESLINRLSLTLGGELKVKELLDEIGAGCRSESLNAGNATEVVQEHLTIQKAIGQTVELGDLQLLKYRVKSGTTLQTVKIIEEVCHKWREIACLLSNDQNKAERLGQQFHNDPSLCLRQLFVDCFINNKPADGRYSQDWNGIIALLEDIEMETIAAKVREIVSNKYNIIQ